MIDSEQELVFLYKKLEDERGRAYQAKRKGGIAWKQHCAAIRNLNRKIHALMKGANQCY